MSDPSKPVSILMVSTDVEAGEAVKADLSVVINGSSILPVQNQALNIQMKLGPPTSPEEWRAAMQDADVIALLVRHIDVLSLDEIRTLHALIAEQAGKHFGVLILRNEGESDFKMSCPYCGQKIWVRDSDLNKRGRCPNCKKGFNLPSQIRHLRNALHLTEEIPVMMLVKGNPASAKIAAVTLAKPLLGAEINAGESYVRDAVLNNTVRIDRACPKTPCFSFSTSRDGSI